MSVWFWVLGARARGTIQWPGELVIDRDIPKKKSVSSMQPPPLSQRLKKRFIPRWLLHQALWQNVERKSDR